MKKVRLDILSLWQGLESHWKDISAQAYGETWAKAKRSAKGKTCKAAKGRTKE